MTYWKIPPEIKVYEALGAVADGRVQWVGNTASVLSSSGNKSYTVEYDSDHRAIVANDNGSYWQGYVGYPALALLMCLGILSYDARLAEHLKSVPWKDLNTRSKNDYDKTLEMALEDVSSKDKKLLKKLVEKIIQEVIDLHLVKLKMRTKPPKGY